LWLWVLAVMVAIYSTLGVARGVVDALRERNLLRVALGVAVVVVVGVLVWRWVRERPGAGEVGVAIAVAAAYGWTWLRLSVPEERTHLIEYSLVAVLIHMALLERGRNGRDVCAPA
jgi:branched-subunit amino acid ABC-type transport system permease component